jgi:hypothetical protein
MGVAAKTDTIRTVGPALEAWQRFLGRCLVLVVGAVTVYVVAGAVLNGPISLSVLALGVAVAFCIVTAWWQEQIAGSMLLAVGGLGTLFCIDVFFRSLQVEPEVSLADRLRNAAMPLAVGAVPALVSGWLLLAAARRAHGAPIGRILAMLEWLGVALGALVLPISLGSLGLVVIDNLRTSPHQTLAIANGAFLLVLVLLIAWESRHDLPRAPYARPARRTPPRHTPATGL